MTESSERTVSGTPAREVSPQGSAPHARLLRRYDVTPQQVRDLRTIERFEDWTAWPLFAGAVAFFAGFTWSLVVPHPNPEIRHWIGVGTVALWIWFGIDYVVRFALAASARSIFFRTRMFDLVSLILPVLRPFLIVVYVWRLPWFRRGDANRLRVRYVLATVLFSFVYVYVSSYLVWIAERGAKGANILNLGDAIWWGFTTISTVGYGDFVPITLFGRFLAVCLMVGGVVLIGVITASLISSLSDQLREVAVRNDRPFDQEAPIESGTPSPAAAANTPDVADGDAVRSARDDR